MLNSKSMVAVNALFSHKVYITPTVDIRRPRHWHYEVGPGPIEDGDDCSFDFFRSRFRSFSGFFWDRFLPTLGTGFYSIIVFFLLSLVQFYFIFLFLYLFFLLFIFSILNNNNNIINNFLLISLLFLLYIYIYNLPFLCVLTFLCVLKNVLCILEKIHYVLKIFSCIKKIICIFLNIQSVF